MFFGSRKQVYLGDPAFSRLSTDASSKGGYSAWLVKDRLPLLMTTRSKAFMPAGCQNTLSS